MMDFKLDLRRPFSVYVRILGMVYIGGAFLEVWHIQQKGHTILV